jgi:hypothetical protein
MYVSLYIYVEAFSSLDAKFDRCSVWNWNLLQLTSTQVLTIFEMRGIFFRRKF